MRKRTQRDINRSKLFNDIREVLVNKMKEYNLLTVDAASALSQVLSSEIGYLVSDSFEDEE